MNNELKRLKTDFDHYLSPKPTFTEKDKDQIRKKMETNKGKARQSPYLIPQLLSAAFIIFSVVIGSSFLFNNLMFQNSTDSIEKNQANFDTHYSNNQIQPTATYSGTNSETPIEKEASQTEFSSFELTEDQLELYEMFADRKDEEILRDLRPFVLFQMFFHAELNKDYETQYAFFIQDDEYIKVFETVDDYIDAIRNSSVDSNQTIELIKSEITNGAKLKEWVSNDGRHASIIISAEKGLSFGLSKNKNGIWKVNWLPLQ